MKDFNDDLEDNENDDGIDEFFNLYHAYIDGELHLATNEEFTSLMDNLLVKMDSLGNPDEETEVVKDGKKIVTKIWSIGLTMPIKIEMMYDLDDDISTTPSDKPSVSIPSDTINEKYDKSLTVDQLEVLLADAVSIEDYSEAIELRDKIKGLKK